MKALTSPPARSWTARFFDRFVEWAQRRIVAASKVGDHPVFDNTAFDWVPALEARWPAIRAELDQVLKSREDIPGFHEITPEVRTITTDRDWKTFMFLGYGMRSETNLARCPDTAAALALIPDLRTAFFSILEPGKRIPRHRGPYNGVLRLHLGLIVPEPRERCWIKVDERLCTWNEGQALIIDDMYPHEVHNDTNGIRVVLFVDFDRPLRGWVRWMNKLILALAPLTPELQTAKANLAAWEKAHQLPD
ncbi:aspartyl/asparaginyl beta-hydroxylase domain-containing protein [Tahibacter amnicola]|uniref:Aspartyl/asparaginyl beta-hydroxylase domain-containing protein n=1 Tax=Tahibacter amnicola TaxID=2976241 RepID=A0ABY6BH39_9GAMM|nr:aspartyl/asparaginyl beta-hydroxylase domain-containing protein [Tahibacter amnicola]UXI68827.1 aspartyl/asparaginyl beta-hydroxylase domain-containing protein [Tahibacter amnicola]